MRSATVKKKSLKLNAIFNGFYQILSLLAPLITTPYVSRVLGPDALGNYSYYYSILSYFSLIAVFGFNDYGTKAIAAVRDNKNEKSRIFWGIFSTKLIISLLCLITYFSVVFFLFSNNTTAIFIFLGMSLYIISTLVDPTFYFQGEENFVSISLRNGLMRILTIVLIFVFVNDSSDLIPYTLVLSVGNLFATIIMFFSFKKTDLVKIDFKNLAILHHLKSAFPFFVPSLAVSLFSSLNQTMLGALVEDSVKGGYFSQATKIVTILATFAGSLSIIMLSRMSYLINSGQKNEVERKIKQTLQAYWVVALPLFWGILSVNRDLVPVFLGEEFTPAIIDLYILCPLILFSPFSGLLGSLYFRPQNKIWIQTSILLLASLLNIAISTVLIPLLQDIGTSLARLIAEFIQIPLLIFFVRKTIPLKIIFKDFIKPFDNSLIMFLSVTLIHNILTNHFIPGLCLFFEIVLGILIYCILEYFTKEPFFCNFVTLLLAKMKRVLRITK